MSGLRFLRGPRQRPQRPSPGSEHRGLHRAHLPHALVTRTPTWRQRAGTRRFGQRGRSPDPSRSLLTGPSRRRTSEAGDPHAHVIAAKKAGHEVGRDQVARLTAVSGIRGDECHRGLTRETPWCRRRFRPRSAGLSIRTPAESRTGHQSTPPKRWSTFSPRRHEVQDRRRGGRLSDDGPDGPLSPLGGPAPPGCVPRRSLVLPRSGPLRCREGGPTVREAARRAEIGAVPSVGQPGERRHRTPKSLNGFDPAELVVGPGRGGGRDGSHLEAVTVSSFCGGGTRIQGSLGDPLSETLSWGPEPSTSSGPALHRTRPPANRESKVRSLHRRQGELIARRKSRRILIREDRRRPRTCREAFRAASEL